MENSNNFKEKVKESKMKIRCYLLSILLVLILTVSANAYIKVELGPTYFPQKTIGRPISNAQIYVGIPDTDPEIVGNQLTLYIQEEDGTIIAVAQPIRTSAGGIPIYDNSPVTLLVDQSYSLKVLSSTGSQIYYIPRTNISNPTPDYCTPDYVAVDQGVVGDLITVKSCVDTIGADNGTILFKHNSGGATTTYTFITAEEIPANIDIIVEKGAIISGNMNFGDGKSREVYPEWWGVDGTADQVQIKAAWDSLPVDGGTVKLTKDTYSFNATLVPTISNVTLDISTNTTITMTNASNCVILNISGLDDITIEGDGTIDGNGTNQTYNIAYYGIYGVSCNNIKIRNITVTNSTSYAIHITGIVTDYSDNILVENTSVLYAGNNGIAVRGYVNNVRILNNKVENACYLANGTGGIFVGNYSRNILVNGNSVIGTGKTNNYAGNGIYVYYPSAYGVRVTNNYVYNNNHIGIETHSPGSVISGNYVEANALGETEEGGIWVGSNASGSLVSSNVSIGNGAYAIRVQETKNIVIANNVGLNSQTASSLGLRIYTSSNCITSGNVFSDNQTPKTQGRGISTSDTNTDMSFIGNIVKGNLTTDRILVVNNEECQKLGNIEAAVSEGYTYSKSLNYLARYTTVLTLTGHATFNNGSGEIFIRDPGGVARNFNPTGSFEPGHTVLLINTADAAETITFDSAGLNQAVAQNQRGIFVYSGTAWLKIYVGS